MWYTMNDETEPFLEQLLFSGSIFTTNVLQYIVSFWNI